MQCQTCGNVAKIIEKGKEVKFIHLYQCDKCKYIACSDCVVVGEHEKEIHENLVRHGFNLLAEYCPSCGEKLEAFID